MEYTEMVRAFNRDSLRRVGIEKQGEFYLTPEQSQELMPVDLEIAKQSAWTGTIESMDACVMCNEPFVKIPANKVVCSPACRKAYKAQHELQRYHDGKQTRWTVGRVDDIAFATPDPYTNLMLSIAQSAQDAGDEAWLLDNYDLYASAILGRQIEEFKHEDNGRD